MKQLNKVIFFIVALTNGVHLVFGDGDEKTMFRKNLDDEFEAIDNVKTTLDTALQTAIDENPGNKNLIAMQLDFKNNFHPVVTHLKELHRIYLMYCNVFDPIYAQYLKQVTDTNDKEKLKKFNNLAKQWEGKFRTNFMVTPFTITVKKKLLGLADPNAVFMVIMDEAIKSNTVKGNIKTWNSVKKVAKELDKSIQKHISSRDRPNEFAFLEDIYKVL
ncbi:uncharacterized protein LOC116337099 [Contarinia nasturtii]|uniref:uncharacterized protein LOC116337099 n=1 Tax=Contarinia nasturtii TaxID=265458 RepID=UPI0012D3AC44|nr:uncharacterized protein LOC116337099 [Contarinia nasturtii]